MRSVHIDIWIMFGYIDKGPTVNVFQVREPKSPNLSQHTPSLAKLCVHESATKSSLCRPGWFGIGECVWEWDWEQIFFCQHHPHYLQLLNSIWSCHPWTKPKESNELIHPVCHILPAVLIDSPLIEHATIQLTPPSFSPLFWRPKTFVEVSIFLICRDDNSCGF